MNIRKATREDLSRVAEIFVFNNRINYYPIFKDESFSFGELQVVSLIKNYFGKDDILETVYVSEIDGLIMGFMEIKGVEVQKLYVDPFFQKRKIGHELLEYAVSQLNVEYMWALEKNVKARAFYNRHGFVENGEKELEEGTTEYLFKLVRETK